MKRLIYIITIVIIIVFAAAGCKNPLIGLGPAADLDVPEGSFNEYKNGDYVSGKIELKGSSSDDVRVESVRAVINKTVLEAKLDSRGQSTNWSIPIDTKEYPDGEYTIILIITDSSGREVEKRLLLYFDNTPPTVMVTSSEGITVGAATNSPVIRGEAYDYMFSRIDHLDVEVVEGNAKVQSLMGTNGWGFTLRTTGTATYKVKIRAYDTAGNVSGYIYNRRDLPDGTRIEELADSDKSGALNGFDLESVRKAEQEIAVDLSADEPKITVSNPEEGKTAEKNTLGGSSAAQGYIEDDDEVDIDTIYISINGGIDWEQLSGDQLEGSGGFVRWRYDLSSLNNGSYDLRVKAMDTSKPAGDAPITGYSEIVPFTIDKDAPAVSITSPAPGTYLNTGDFTVIGKATDPSGPDTISSVQISINDGEFFDVTTSISGDDLNWDYPFSGVEEGTIRINVKVIDDSLKSSNFSQQFYVDTTPPEIDFLSPGENDYVNGTVSIRGVSSDNNSLESVRLQFGGFSFNQATASPLVPSEFYNWSRNLITTDHENGASSVQVNGNNEPTSGTNIWRILIWVQAVDKAGNETIESHRLFIDNSLDRPTVNINSPADGAILAGSVMLSGSASDDRSEPGEDIHHVEIRIWKGEDDGTGGHEFNEEFELDDLLGLTANNYGGETWYTVDGTNNWQQELNVDDEFYPDASINHDGTVKINVRAVDMKGGIPDLVGPAKELHITFDDTVPYFENLSHADWDYARGTFDLTGTVRDDDDVRRLRISYDAGAHWQLIGENLGDTYDFSHTIDSNAITGSSGILYLRLEALDSANYKTLYFLKLNIDNVDPIGNYTGSNDITGSSAIIQGSAEDTGSVSGIDNIAVYFERGGKIYDPKTTYTYAANADEGDIDTEQITFGPGNYYPVDPEGAGVIIIDAMDELGDDTGPNGDDDGYNESLTLTGSTWYFWAEINSENIPDGPINLHYVVTDKAGNQTHYVKNDAVINNNVPVISQIDLGTDVNYSGVVNTNVGNGETFRYIDGSGVNGGGVFYTDFNSDLNAITVRNSQLYVNADVLAGSGNGSLNWELYSAHAPGVNLIASGSSVTITSNFPADGTDRQYSLLVTDSAGLSDEVIILLGMDNTDISTPTVVLDDLTLSHSDVIAARGGADNYGYAVSGYNPAASPQWTSTASGRLVPKDDSHNDTDADVSGSIIISGEITEDKALESLALTITGYDGGSGVGAAFTILDWNTTANNGLKVASGVTGTPHIAEQSLTESGGHMVKWSFEFDTSQITDVAAENIRVTAVATDKSGNSNTPTNDTTPDNYTMDVMPFVTDIVLSNEAYTAEDDIIRTKLGRWPIRDNSYLIIKGFNLGSTVGIVGSDAAGTAPLSQTSPGTAFNDVTVSGSHQSVNAYADITNSGWLVMTTNGIPLMNYNLPDSMDTVFDEDDSSNPYHTSDGQWTADRYLQVWEVSGQMPGSDDAVWGSMASNPVNGNLYAAWSEYSNSDAYYAIGGGSRTRIFHMYDPPEYTDIALNSAGSPNIVYLANFFNGGSSWGRLALSFEGGGSSYVVDRLEYDQELYQFKCPRIAVSGSGAGTYSHISYYDNHSGALKYSRFLGTTNQISYSAADNNIIAGTQAQDTTDVGSHNDIALDSAGRPVIAYYDTGNSSLRVTRASSATPAAGPAAWHDQEVLPVNSYVGHYVSVRLDSTNRIHITAYKISTGDLLYYSAPEPATVNDDYVFDIVGQEVDTDGNMGAYGSLDLMGDVPVVGYVDTSNAGTFQGLKYAYLVNGTWEHGTVPLENTVKAEQVSAAANNAASNTEYDFALGFHSNNYRYARMRQED